MGLHMHREEDVDEVRHINIHIACEASRKVGNGAAAIRGRGYATPVPNGRGSYRDRGGRGPRENRKPLSPTTKNIAVETDLDKTPLWSLLHQRHHPKKGRDRTRVCENFAARRTPGTKVLTWVACQEGER